MKQPVLTSNTNILPQKETICGYTEKPLQQSILFGWGMLTQTFLLPLLSVKFQRFTGMRKAGGSTGEMQMTAVFEEPTAAVKDSSIGNTVQSPPDLLLNRKPLCMYVWLEIKASEAS